MTLSPPEEERSVLGLLVVLLRSLRHWSQAELARASGVQKSQISLYEQWKSAPTETTLKRFAAAVGITWADAEDDDRRAGLGGFCWGFLGNAQRVKGDFLAAEEAFLSSWPLRWSRREIGRRRSRCWRRPPPGWTTEESPGICSTYASARG